MLSELSALSKKGLNTEPYLFPHNYSFEPNPKCVRIVVWSLLTTFPLNHMPGCAEEQELITTLIQTIQAGGGQDEEVITPAVKPSW